MKNYSQDFAKKMFEPLNKGDGFIYSLEALRGLASLVILLVHYKHFLMGPSQLGVEYNDIVKVPFYDFLKPILDYGANAVQLFWLISGFVFVHVYGGKSSISFGKFTIQRLARLYPLHLATLLLIAILQIMTFSITGEYSIYSNNDFFHFLLNIFFASEWGWQDGRSFNGPVWSVSVEIFSYFIFFIMIRSVSISAFSLFLLILSSLALYYILASYIFLCSYYFFVGCFVNLIYQICKPKFEIFVKRYFFTAFLIFFTAVIQTNNDLIPKSITYAVLFSLIVFLLAILDSKIPKTNLSVYLGNTSYGNYLLHSPLQAFFLYLCSLGLLDIEMIFHGWFLLSYLFLVFSVSLLSFYLYERPVKNKIITWYKESER